MQAGGGFMHSELVAEPAWLFMVLLMVHHFQHHAKWALNLVFSLSQTLLEGIGWPRAAQNMQPGTGDASYFVLKGSGQRSAEDELRVQLITLQVVRTFASLVFPFYTHAQHPQLATLQSMITWFVNAQ